MSESCQWWFFLNEIKSFMGIHGWASITNKWQNAVWQGRPSTLLQHLQHFAHALHNPSSSEKKFQFQKLLPCFDSLFAVKWFHWSSDNRFNIHQLDSNHVPAVIFMYTKNEWFFIVICLSEYFFYDFVAILFCTWRNIVRHHLSFLFYYHRCN